MYCYALFGSKFKLHKQAILKLWTVEYHISFFFQFVIYAYAKGALTQI